MVARWLNAPSSLRLQRPSSTTSWAELTDLQRTEMAEAASSTSMPRPSSVPAVDLKRIEHVEPQQLSPRFAQFAVAFSFAEMH